MSPLDKLPAPAETVMSSLTANSVDAAEEEASTTAANARLTMPFATTPLDKALGSTS